MNTITKILATVIICLVFTKAATAQTDSLHHRTKSIYIEVLPLKSMGTLFTANYEIRKTQNGLGVHGGTGVVKSLIGGNTFYFPVGVNVLVGKKGPHFFEPGLELMTILYGKYYNNKTEIALLPSIGYRYQPSYNGITFRAFGASYTNFKGSAFITAGVSLGYKF